MKESLFESICLKLRGILQSRKNATISNRFGISDVVQESALQVWQHMDRNQIGESQINTHWLRSVAVGHYCKMLRFHLATKRNVNAEIRQRAAEQHFENEFFASATQHEQAMILMESIEALPVLQKQIVVLRFFQEKTWHEIANETDQSIHASRQLLGDAIRTLRSTEDTKTVA